MPTTGIEEFFSTHKSVYDFLLAKGEPTFATETNDNFRRSLVLAIASSFEHEITGIMREIPRVHAGKSTLVAGILEQRVISRQYHTYFDWERRNANKFFGMFGSEFSERAKAHVRDSPSLNQSIVDFLELGETRNKLVHLDYVTFDINKTPDDIIALYRSARLFISFLREWLLDEKPEPEQASDRPRDSLMATQQSESALHQSTPALSEASNPQ